jgi:hypothetical protein
MKMRVKLLRRGIPVPHIKKDIFRDIAKNYNQRFIKKRNRNYVDKFSLLSN